MSSGLLFHRPISEAAPRPKLTLFIGLNPSVATEEANDHTIRKDLGFLRRWGCSSSDEPTLTSAEFDDSRKHRFILRRPGLLKANLFSLVSTDPRGLLAAWDRNEPISKARNDDAIRYCAEAADLVVVCWGGPHGTKRLQDIIDSRAREVSRMLVELGVTAKCLGYTKDGRPRHTLMLAYSTPLQPWSAL